ncbi:F-box protein SKIP19 [Platanthera guangdongensis]|uniref:F-box protein SKIP19 n=1 Tax=Platanthera guangdongensis TaxID=2320717 RepID=A0ABR2MRP3_9ASPA
MTARSMDGGAQDIFLQQSSRAPVDFRSPTVGESVAVSVNDDGRSSAVTGFGDACVPVGHMKMGGCNYAIPCYGFLAPQLTSLWNPLLKLESLSPLLPAMVETPVGRVSEEQTEVTREDSDPKSEGEWRNWADLPGDILSSIFKKIGAVEIFLSAQSVCKPWRQLSLESSLWKRIELRMDKRLDNNNMVYLTMMAVERSEGCVEELFMESFSTDALMLDIAHRATRLRSLHLIDAFINREPFVEALRNLPLLEELELTHCSCFSYKIVERIGETCPQLKSFRFNDWAPASIKLYHRSDPWGNTAAFSIAKHFKQLRRLQLFGNYLTGIGLSAILHNCPELESLDIRCCFNVEGNSMDDETLKNKCERIKELRLPNDSTADYETRDGCQLLLELLAVRRD